MDLYRTAETWTGAPGTIAPADGSASAGVTPGLPIQADQAYGSVVGAQHAAPLLGTEYDLGPNNERLEDAKPELVHALRELVRQYRQEGVVARRHEIRRIRQARLFWQGLQYAWWNPNDMNWHLPFEQRFSDDRELEEMPRYQFVTNFYQGFGLSFIAVLSQDVPSELTDQQLELAQPAVSRSAAADRQSVASAIPKHSEQSRLEPLRQSRRHRPIARSAGQRVRCSPAICAKSPRSHSQLRRLQRASRRTRAPEGNCRGQPSATQPARLHQHSFPASNGCSAGPLWPVRHRHEPSRPHSGHSRRASQRSRKRLAQQRRLLLRTRLQPRLKPRRPPQRAVLILYGVQKPCSRFFSPHSSLSCQGGSLAAALQGSCYACKW